MGNKGNEPTPFARRLGERLKTARGDRSFQEISDATGGFVHPRMIDNYERGTEPRLSTFYALTAALGETPESILPAPLVRAVNTKDVSAIVNTIVEPGGRVTPAATLPEVEADADEIAEDLGIL